MRLQIGIKGMIAAALVTLMLPAAMPAYATDATINRFYANCGNFSVEVAVKGTHYDFSEFDKFRYLITDGDGKKLYLENATRPVGTPVTSIVVNMPYDTDGVDGPPAKNPIKFQVLELDAADNVVGVLKEARYDAACLAPSGNVTHTADFRPPHFLKAFFNATTPIYQQPGREPVTLNIEQGKEHFAIYRSADSQWIAVDVGGNEIVWVPTSAVNVDLSRLNAPPTRIDYSDPSKPTVPVPTPEIQLGGVATARITTNLRLRLAPSLTAPILTVIPRNTLVPVYARNPAGTFVLVTYGGLTGWVSSGFIVLMDSRLLDLPAFQPAF